MGARTWRGGAALAAAALAAAGCGVDARGIAEVDLTPPVLVGVQARGPRSAAIVFSEAVTLVDGSFASEPALELIASRSEGGAIALETGLQEPGTRYQLQLAVTDGRGNRAEVIVALYGFNPEVPAIRINEITVRGTAAHPDMVELRVEAPGCMGGLVLLNGTPSSWTSRLVFPAFRVEGGDFLLAHFKPEGLAEEVDETSDRTASAGLDSSDAAFDLWVPEGAGLNGNNGVISLYARVGGPVLDAILYSNRTSASDADFLGFGTAETMARALEIAASGAWVCQGETVRPEDAVNPEASTSTRSICRRRGTDTDSRLDWYVVPTRGATFGGENLEEEYAP